MKKFSILLVVLLSISMVACNTNPGTTTKPAATTAGSTTTNNGTATTDPSDKTLSLITYLDPNGADLRGIAMKKIIEKFATTTGYTVVADTVGWEQIEERVLMGYASGNSPDIAFVRSQSVQLEAQSKALIPLTELVADGWTEDSKDIMMWDTWGVVDGVKYCIPMAVYVSGMYVRTDILAQNGITKVPTTWAEFCEVGQKVTNSEHWGYIFAANASQPASLDYIQPMVESYGGKILNKDGTAAFNSAEGIKAFKMIKDMVYVYKMTPTDVTTFAYADANDMYAAGRSVLHIDGSHKWSKYAKGVGAENLSVFAIPSETGAAGPTLTSGWALGIPTKSSNPKMAWEFIKTFFSYDNAYMYSKEANEVAVRLSIYKKEPFYTNDSFGKTLSWFANYAAEKGSVPVGPITFNNLSEILSIAVQDIVKDPNSNVESIINKAAEDYNKVVKK